jgi:hypothetical protein
MAPAFVERVLRPLFGNRTLRGFEFLEPWARAVRGLRLRSKEPGHFNAHSRGCGRALWAHLFRRHCRARSGQRGQADVTAHRGSLVAVP